MVPQDEESEDGHTRLDAEVTWTDRYSPGPSLAYLVEMGYVEMGTERGKTQRGPPQISSTRIYPCGDHQERRSQATAEVESDVSRMRERRGGSGDGQD